MDIVIQRTFRIAGRLRSAFGSNRLMFSTFRTSTTRLEQAPASWASPFAVS